MREHIEEQQQTSLVAAQITFEELKKWLMRKYYEKGNWLY